MVGFVEQYVLDDHLEVRYVTWRFFSCNHDTPFCSMSGIDPAGKVRGGGAVDRPA